MISHTNDNNKMSKYMNLLVQSVDDIVPGSYQIRFEYK